MSEHTTPADRAAELFIYAPLGLLMNAEELLPGLVAKGRQQVEVARMFGSYAVRQGQAEAGRVIDGVLRQATPVVEAVLEALVDLVGGRDPTPGAETDGTGHASGTPPVVVVEEPAPHDGTSATTPGAAAPAPESAPAAALAIPDYDSLAASQVVPRLAGLAPAELDAVRGYEAAHRGRKTILNRIAQLQSG